MGQLKLWLIPFPIIGKLWYNKETSMPPLGVELGILKHRLDAHPSMILWSSRLFRQFSMIVYGPLFHPLPPNVLKFQLSLVSWIRIHPRNLKELVRFCLVTVCTISIGKRKSRVDVYIGSSNYLGMDLLTSMETRRGIYERHLRHWEKPTSIKTSTT